MSKYNRDGSVRQAGMKVQRREAGSPMFGIYKGVVKQIIPPDDPRNGTGEHVQYIVRVGRQDYPGAVSARALGGIFNHGERICKPSEKSFTGKMNTSTFDEDLDGEIVYVLFLAGNIQYPIIVGKAQHPRQASYKKYKKADGVFWNEEFNGVEFNIDKDGNYTIKQVGNKDLNGKIKNEAGVSSKITLQSNGDIELNTHGTDDLKIKLTKSSKKIEAFAQNNKITMDASGVKVEDKNSNSITMSSGSVNINVSGSCNVKASGSATVDAASISLKAGSNSFKGGVVCDNAINNDPITGIPLTGVGGVTGD